MLWRKSYSDKALKLAAAALEVVDEKIETDLYNTRPSDIPLNRDWQFNGFLDIFSSSKKQLAEKRTSFNIGVMNGIASVHYDGEPHDFENFLKEAVKINVFGSTYLVKQIGVIERRYPVFFARGIDYSSGFAERHLPVHTTEIEHERSRDEFKIASPTDTSNRNVNSGPDITPSSDFSFHSTDATSNQTHLASARSPVSEGSFYRDFRARTQAKRFSSYRTWAMSEEVRKLESSEALKKFGRYNLLLDDTPDADFLKPAEYSKNWLIAGLADEVREAHLKSRDTLYRALQPSEWYAQLAHEMINEIIKKLEDLNQFIEEIDPHSKVFKTACWFGGNSSGALTKEESIRALIKQLSLSSFPGFFRICIWPSEASENQKSDGCLRLCVNIDGTFRREWMFDKYNSSILLPPVDFEVNLLANNRVLKREKHSDFVDFVCMIDTRHKPFVTEFDIRWVEEDWVEQDIPFFLLFSMIFEHIISEIEP